ncbi:MAG: membrane protein insertion efficiency factor YidD [Thermodesulfobacteriota bacterium]|nr:membrane protein insertion efficiency factor YidD [Thermodesulfobacteriota bacterium]
MSKRLLIFVIRMYQCCISPFTMASCRFYPSCSHYALEAVSVHGSLKGAFLAIKRLLKCHPFHPGGFDPVPEKNDI